MMLMLKLMMLMLMLMCPQEREDGQTRGIHGHWTTSQATKQTTVIPKVPAVSKIHFAIPLMIRPTFFRPNQFETSQNQSEPNKENNETQKTS
jgi:hypothetical protein